MMISSSKLPLLVCGRRHLQAPLLPNVLQKQGAAALLAPARWGQPASTAAPASQRLRVRAASTGRGEGAPTPDQVQASVQLVNQAYQELTGAELPPSAFKGGLGRNLAYMAENKPASTWMASVRAAIEAVGVEVTKVLVSNNPCIVYTGSDLLAQQLHEYGQLTGWDRERVVRWLQTPRFAKLLERRPINVVTTALDYMSYAGLSREEMLDILDAKPAAFAVNTASLKTGWSALQELQATHPSWAEEWSKCSVVNKALLASHPPSGIHRLRYLASTGQQDKMNLRLAIKIQPPKRFLTKFPNYTPPPPAQGRAE